MPINLLYATSYMHQVFLFWGHSSIGLFLVFGQSQSKNVIICNVDISKQCMCLMLCLNYLRVSSQTNVRNAHSIKSIYGLWLVVNVSHSLLILIKVDARCEASHKNIQ